MTDNRSIKRMRRLWEAYSPSESAPLEPLMEGAEETSPRLTPEPGVLLSHYRIEEEIGRGGTATVYRGVDMTLNRKGRAVGGVLIRFIHP